MAYLENDRKQAAEVFTVRSYDCGPLEGMRPSAILRCFQEMAIQHCALFGLPLSRMEALNVAFMLTRVRLSIPHAPRCGENVKAVTWHRATKGVLFLRDSVLEDPEGRLLASCAGQWVLVHREKHSILRPRSFEEYTLLLQPERSLGEEGAPKLRLPAALAPAGERVIRHSDLDHNCHLNNCVYADFLEDYIPAPLQGKRFSSIDLHFMAEALEGDTVSLAAGQEHGVHYMRGTHARGICFEAACTLCDAPPAPGAGGHP